MIIYDFLLGMLANKRYKSCCKLSLVDVEIMEIAMVRFVMVEKIELVFTIKYYFLDYPQGEDVNFIESILV